ncbi:hypothetical protein CFOL_v3_22968 [Cephalotus follicularis]|uniref:Uncharacterized protein n=1 Tax=Cephalotus follicularis TaxID=3775 RepID=A0A1Q3CHD0_CEPFO|nr:hypothetical protein CFOL_v3_22968 [Cephalotus follicularis]
MDIRNWCNSGSKKTVRLGQCYEEIGSLSSPSTTRSSKLSWKVLLMKLKKERRKIFESAAPVQLSYDPYTYSQNFDQGFSWDEPDCISRSFSVRFADPSRITLKKAAL